jgi:hypothetical protein
LIQLKEIRHTLAVVVESAAISGFHGFIKFLMGFQ